MSSDFSAPGGEAAPLPPPPPGGVSRPSSPAPPPAPPVVPPAVPPPPGAFGIPPPPGAVSVPPPPGAGAPAAAPPAAPSTPVAAPSPVNPPPVATAGPTWTELVADQSPPPTPTMAPPPTPTMAPPPTPTMAPSPTPGASPVAVPVEPQAERHDLSDLLAQIGRGESDSPVSAPAVGDVLTDPRDLERPTQASNVQITTTGGLDFDPTFAPFASRVIGFVIDSIILYLAMLPGFFLALVGGPLILTLLGLVVAVAGFLAVNVLAARAIAANRQWVGNRVTGSYVVDAVNGSNLDFTRAFTRLVVRHLFSPIFLFGFITAFTDGQRRTFHDRIASSLVVGRQRETWTAG